MPALGERLIDADPLVAPAPGSSEQARGPAGGIVGQMQASIAERMALADSTVDEPQDRLEDLVSTVSRLAAYPALAIAAFVIYRVITATL